MSTSKSCCYDADDIMAEDNQRAEKYIVTIPFSVLLSIYQSLDADKGWEKLAAEAGYTFDKIRLLELEGARNQGSPSRSLLWELGSRNTTVRQLYSRLSNLGRYREMKILEDYVHSPSSSSFVDNGLKGLPDVPQDTSNSLKGLTSPMSKKNNNSNSNNSSMHSNSVNFNQHMSDVNISMKCQQTDKCYPGKEMPFFSPSSSSSSTSSSEINRRNPPSNPTGIAAPTLKPTNPGCQGNNVNLLQNMIKQIPGGASNSASSPSSSSSSSSSGHGLSKYQTSPSASSPSSSSSPPLLSDGQFSSSVSSLTGLENTFEDHVALIGSARYSYAEVLQATNGFSERNKLGEGAFGKVYFGVLRQNKCAVKKLSEAENQESVVERSTQIKRELTSLLKFRHENIVMLYGYAVDGECLCLIYQYMPNGSLEDRLMCKKNTPPLVWSQRLNIMVGACQGLNFLHTMGEQPLIHGDIKSANILLDKYMEAKIGDLGQAQQASGREEGSTSTSRLTHITRAEASKLYGTRAYQPGEVHTGSQPSTKSDVFAMGVVLLEVFSGEKAYDERREGEQFLADYFRSLKMESGEDACVNKLDRRGGDFPRDVCLAMLDLADKATSHLKRKRPDSSQMLQKMTEVEELYTQRTGIKHTGMDSLPGSEHSCHMSHCSSPGASVPNLTGAPPPQHKPPQPSQGPASLPGKPCNNFSVNVNQGQPAEKHYAMHLAHEKPSNCPMASLNTDTASSPSSCTPGDHSNPSSLTSSSGRSPIDYFQKGQALPPAFRLQQAYDSQGEAERRRISRISQCHPTKQLAAVQAEGAEGEVLPQADPAKLAALEQFDRQNLHVPSEEKESNSFQSDPKKLAALKQFDDQASHVHLQEEVFHTQHRALAQESSSLASDPRKLAQLRLFDEANPVTPAHSQQEERQVLASDPRKLAALTQFDAANCQTGTASTVSSTASVPYRLAAGTQSSAGSNAPALSSVPGQPQSLKSVETRQDCSSHDPFPVSQLDYVVSSQKEALDSYLSTGSHQQVSTPQVYPYSAPGMNGSVMAAGSAAKDTPQGSLTHTTSGTCEGHTPSPLPSSNFVSSDGPILSSNFTTSEEALLRRQRNFFDMYSKALEEEMDDGDEDDDNFEDANACLENGYVEESDNTAYVASALPVHGGTPGEAYSSPVQEQVSTGRGEGHCHPIPTEQDESVLYYFKQKQQHYGKTFNKSQVSQC